MLIRGFINLILSGSQYKVLQRWFSRFELLASVWVLGPLEPRTRHTFSSAYHSGCWRTRLGGAHCRLWFANEALSPDIRPH